MTGIVYTMTRSKLSKKQRAAREQLLKEQRAIKSSLKQSTSGRLEISGPVCARPVDQHIPSRGTGMGNATLTARNVYTGDKMIGIGQLHKSNAVPIFRTEDAEDLARMRR